MAKALLPAPVWGPNNIRSGVHLFKDAVWIAKFGMEGLSLEREQHKDTFTWLKPTMSGPLAIPLL